MKRSISIAIAVAAGAIVAIPQTVTTLRTSNDPKDPGVRSGAASAGKALDGLSPGQLNMFNEGKDAFEETGFVRNPPPNGDAGLGPGFNGDSCKSCHAFPSTGGTIPKLNPQVAL